MQKDVDTPFSTVDVRSGVGGGRRGVTTIWLMGGEEDILPSPPDGSFFSTERVMFQANLVAQPVEKFFGR
ncbi:MAG: hypothetical protein E3J88_05535 [Anaerolineales bacterium]|nr:MAG: hypothetical protein E3J88_05535 [Anaerolineales bacterium]